MKITITLFLISFLTSTIYSQRKLEKVTLEYNCNYSIYKNEKGNQYPEKKYYFVEFEDPKRATVSEDNFDSSPLGLVSITTKEVSFNYGIKFMKTEGDKDYYVVVRDSENTGINVIVITTKKGVVAGIKYDRIIQLASFRNLDFKNPIFFENYYLQFKGKRELYSEPYVEDKK